MKKLLLIVALLLSSQTTLFAKNNGLGNRRGMSHEQMLGQPVKVAEKPGKRMFKHANASEFSGQSGSFVGVRHHSSNNPEEVVYGQVAGMGSDASEVMVDFGNGVESVNVENVAFLKDSSAPAASKSHDAGQVEAYKGMSMQEIREGASRNSQKLAEKHRLEREAKAKPAKKAAKKEKAPKKQKEPKKSVKKAKKASASKKPAKAKKEVKKSKPKSKSKSKSKPKAKKAENNY